MFISSAEDADLLWQKVLQLNDNLSIRKRYQSRFMDNHRVTIIAIAIFSLLFAGITLPIYRNYLLRVNLNEAIQILDNYSAEVLNANPNLNSWPHSNIIPSLASKKIYAIPKQIHLIWIGGKLPKKYLENLNNLTQLCKNMHPVFAVNIWTDQGSRNSNNTQFQQISGLNIKNLETELLANVRGNNSIYTETEKNSFFKWILFEYLPPANYAAISDLLRIEILRQYGGMYLDVDVAINSAIKDNPLAFAHNLEKLFSTVQVQGGLSCRKNAYITNNNIIIASNDAIVTQQLKALVQYMIITMTDQFLMKMQNCFKDVESYFIAKKSPVAIHYTELKNASGTHQDLVAKLTTNNMPAIRGLTMAGGPYKLATLAEQYLPRDPNAKLFRIWHSKHHISGAPGLAEMEKLFNCYVNDNNWLDKRSRTTQETKLILAKVKEQIKFYLENIHPKNFEDLAFF